MQIRSSSLGSSDREPGGTPSVTNGLSLCTIHHRAFDQDLVGISPDYAVHVHARLLDDEDGPMLELLKKAHATTIQVPQRRSWQPDRELLAARFEAFESAV
jgi:putative restriction endonuclease